MFFLFILLVVVPAGNQMQAKRSKELSFNHSVPMFQALGVQQSVSCGNRLLSQCLTMGRGGHRVWYRVDFPFLLPAPRIGVDNLNVPAPDLFPVGGEGGAPLPLLVGNISSGRGPGGCKSLIQTPPSMTLGNWIGTGLFSRPCQFWSRWDAVLQCSLWLSGSTGDKTVWRLHADAVYI